MGVGEGVPGHAGSVGKKGADAPASAGVETGVDVLAGAPARADAPGPDAPDGVPPADVDLVALAREGAPAGSSCVRLVADALVAEVVLRPQVGMGLLQGVPYACALGAAEALRELGLAREGACVAWPCDVELEGGEGARACVRTQAGYGKGVFVVAACELPLALVPGDRELGDVGEALACAMARRTDAWARATAAAGASATPLGAILGELFDAVALMGAQVEAVAPSGRVLATGELAGLDVWGRATLRLADGQELDLAPEQARLRRAAG